MLKILLLTLIKAYYNLSTIAIRNPPRGSVELFNSIFCTVAGDCAPPPSGFAQKTLCFTNTQNVVL